MSKSRNFSLPKHRSLLARLKKQRRSITYKLKNTKDQSLATKILRENKIKKLTEKIIYLKEKNSTEDLTMKSSENE